MAEESRIGRSKGGSERDLGAGNGKPALVTKTQPDRLHDGGAPLPSRPMMLGADPDRIAHSLRVLDILERVDADLRTRPKDPATQPAAATPLLSSDSSERRAS